MVSKDGHIPYQEPMWICEVVGTLFHHVSSFVGSQTFPSGRVASVFPKEVLSPRGVSS